MTVLSPSFLEAQVKAGENRDWVTKTDTQFWELSGALFSWILVRIQSGTLDLVLS